MEYILVFDAGTGSVRAVLFNKAGKQVAVSQYEWTHLEDPRYPGSMDFDVNRNWEIIQTCISEVLERSGVPPSSIKAISSTSMREGFVLYDENGKEIWACSNVDARAMAEAKELKNGDPLLEKRLYELSGQTFALGALPRLLWIKNNQPEIYEKIACLTMINDWILFKLTNKLQVDPSNGCTTGLFDLNNRTWTPAIAEACQLKNNIFPPVNEAGILLGTIPESIAHSTGLAKGTLVFSGGGDAQLASVGVGAIGDGQTFICGGSFWQQEINIKEAMIDPDCRIRVNCHAVPDLWQIETIAFFPGLVMRWFRDAFCELEKMEAAQTGRDAYEILEEKAKDVPVGSNGIIPIFSDVMDYISWRHAAPSFLNLTIDSNKTGKKEMFKSIQENACLVTYGNLKIVEEVTGHYPTEAIFAGGASKGKLWSQTLADVLGIPVKIPVEKEAAALGTAIMAGLGAGLYLDLETAISELVGWERVHYPDMDNHRRYLLLYENWRAVYAEQLRLADLGKTNHMWMAPGLSV
ncbi:autoinducer-2 kinase [Neobacillus rhizophilus]|uniref:Autoinducer-2 kinase n=1 Tax=Neobacillus rhizophilus TaxID=2833579 RepID=A0A942YUD3_9BACI|nr:autoinducer-2 kinase [Neobacillus rhizophilus]MBS4213883.1 autoinducer-2 kinase [Neobacillus rhizophilus]